MNLTSSLLAVSLMTVGAAATIQYVSDPSVALSRLNAQSQADAIIDRLQMEARRGKTVSLETDATTGKLIGKLDGNAISIPSDCSFLSSHNGKPGIFLKCTDALASRDRKAEISRVGVARLVGHDPCNSDLFPLPATVPSSGQKYLCQESDNSIITTPPGGGGGGPGIGYGHVDLDSYCGFPTKGLHTHKWDDNANAATFNIVDPVSMQFTPKAVGEGCVSPTQTFAIVVVNGALSPGARISINGGTSCSLATYKRDCTGTEGAFPVYTLGAGGGLGVTQLTSLTISFDSDAISQAKIIPTSTGLVNVSNPTQGKGCEWRNGAATIQIVAATHGSLLTPNLYRADRSPKFVNLSTGATASSCTPGTTALTYTSNGGSGMANTGVLYEVSTFSHLPGAKYVSSSTYTPGVTNAEYCAMMKKNGYPCS